MQMVAVACSGAALLRDLLVRYRIELVANRDDGGNLLGALSIHQRAIKYLPDPLHLLDAACKVVARRRG